MVDSLHGFCLGDRATIIRTGGEFSTPSSWEGEEGRIVYFDTSDNSAVMLLDSDIGHWELSELYDLADAERVRRGLTEGWFGVDELDESRCTWVKIDNISLEVSSKIKWID